MDYISKLLLPLTQNWVFFVFMFALGMVCTQLEVTLHLAGAKPYELSVPELFFDLYVLCCLLLLVPKKVRPWVRWAIAIVLYAIALVDMFCYVRFESTLTPTMLMLAQETDGRETSEFFRSYVGWDLLTTKVGWVLLLLVLHVVLAVCKAYRPYSFYSLYRFYSPYSPYACALLALLTLGYFVYAFTEVRQNKASMLRLFSHSTIGEVEHDLTRRDAATLYLPVYRLAFSVYANHLAGKQLDQVAVACERITVDSCTFRTPNLVLIIGESYNRYHSQLYGYDKPTSPRQLQRAHDSTLIAFTDVVACWNLTSFSFKHFLSLHAIGDEVQNI